MRYLVLGCVFASCVAMADQCPTKAHIENGREVITPCSLDIKGSLPSGTAFELSIHEKQFRKSEATPEDDGSLWGIDGGVPWTVIGSLSLQLSGKRIPVQRKYFADLVNISGASVSERGADVIVAIWGGDGAGAFKGEFVIRNNQLEERTIRMSEAPNQTWERTEIHNDL